jgi:pimeloyl-ACP methyl ester carboxylesterase
MTEPLVLVPGLMCDARVFWPQIVALSRDRVADIAAAIMEQLPARFALAGLGLGGAVAMEMLHRAPERIARLCLMATDPQAETPQMAARREPWIVRARAGRLDEVMREVMPPAHLAPGARRIEVLNRLYAMAADLGADLFQRQNRALQRREDQQGTLRRCKVPTLILCGAHDMETPVRRHEFLARLIPHAQLQVIADAGAVPTLESPARVTRALADWLRPAPD